MATLKEALAAAKRSKIKAAREVLAATPTVTEHASGPCPAVCLAALAGCTYARAADALRPHGYRGAGMNAASLAFVFARVLGRGFERVPHAGSVGATVRERFTNEASGFVLVRGHVMPVVRGRLLNGVGYEMRPCAGAYILEN